MIFRRKKNTYAGRLKRPVTIRMDVDTVSYFKRAPFTYYLFRFVGMAGFEPTASASRTLRSTKLSHIPILRTQTH